ncbi:hypothetical protein [Streptacidiphilus jiangxiensis]|uniref:Ig-like domain-containing protein n=1 Tax=Streptacidiphilus jiangxiensis TaxID=235985 RepID=A0A1H7QY67_STRJI|nr:hypothetical protein [Streptacidiphilus jiangxiensis]SEL52852.1 hypothetical protein SAMN05414137_109277 [Streptacidiphilus jiangxiensis]
MRRGLTIVASALVVASSPALGAAAPVHAAGVQLLSCAVSSELNFTPGVQMVSGPQSVLGALQGERSTGPACATSADGITGAEATLAGTGSAACLPDPVLATVDLAGTMAVTWKKAGGATVGSSQITWTATRLNLGSVVFTGTVSSGLFKGAAASVSGLSADAVTSVNGGCMGSSPLTSVRTTESYLRLTQK